MAPLRWHCAPFRELALAELYELLALRAAVFVVEQRCAYQDLDGLDPAAWHLLGRSRAGGPESSQLLAYARLLPPGARFAEASVGRVVTAPEARGQGQGRALMRRALAEVTRRFGPGPVRIGAQHHLQRFYRELGFEPCGDPYDEDGILHVDMLRRATA